MTFSYRYRYCPTRPVKFEDLQGIRWVYVEAPPGQFMAGLPTSRHEFGVIGTEKMILEKMCLKAGLQSIKYEQTYR
jgi:hypothetical protein